MHPHRPQINLMDTFEWAVCNPSWDGFVTKVNQERRKRWEAARATEAAQLYSQLDLTPEGYVKEWHKRGRRNVSPLPAWEHIYQTVNLIEEAQRQGYLTISTDVQGTITLTPLGEQLCKDFTHATDE